VKLAGDVPGRVQLMGGSLWDAWRDLAQFDLSRMTFSYLFYLILGVLSWIHVKLVVLLILRERKQSKRRWIYIYNYIYTHVDNGWKE